MQKQMKINRTGQVLAIARKAGIIQARDLEKKGIARNYLYSLHKDGLLIKVGRGLYMLPDGIDEQINLIEVAKRVPNSVVCLISALSFYRLTTQLPNEVWLALPRGAWRPRIEYPKLNLTFVSEPAWSSSVLVNNINGVRVRIYSPAKTVADCFKFRSKVGLDVAIEALRAVWRARQATMEELVEAAKIDRVFRIMRPYLEAIV
jgi:predicted transcriptional regulator of viral defense system